MQAWRPRSSQRPPAQRSRRAPALLLGYWGPGHEGGRRSPLTLGTTGFPTRPGDCGARVGDAVHRPVQVSSPRGNAKHP